MGLRRRARKPQKALSGDVEKLKTTVAKRSACCSPGLWRGAEDWERLPKPAQIPTQNCCGREAKKSLQGLTGHQGGNWLGEEVAPGDETPLGYRTATGSALEHKHFGAFLWFAHLASAAGEERKLLSSCRDHSCPQKHKDSPVPLTGSASPVPAIAKETDGPY